MGKGRKKRSTPAAAGSLQNECFTCFYLIISLFLIFTAPREFWLSGRVELYIFIKRLI